MRGPGTRASGAGARSERFVPERAVDASHCGVFSTWCRSNQPRLASSSSSPGRARPAASRSSRPSGGVVGSPLGRERRRAGGYPFPGGAGAVATRWTTAACAAEAPLPASYVRDLAPRLRSVARVRASYLGETAEAARVPPRAQRVGPGSPLWVPSQRWMTSVAVESGSAPWRRSSSWKARASKRARSASFARWRRPSKSSRHRDGAM